jgi:hypothetical protein
MNRNSLTTGLVLLRNGWRVASFLLRNLTAIMMGILALVALVLGYWAWQMGFPANIPIPILIPLALCLILIVAILLGRRRIQRWALARASRGQAAVQKRIAKRMVQEGREKGEEILEKGEEVLGKGVDTARGALSTLASEVKADWKRHVAQPRPARPQPTRCPDCGHPLRPGAKFCDHCGKPRQLTCPKCGQVLRSQAKFCERCGAPMSDGKPS